MAKKGKNGGSSKQENKEKALQSKVAFTAHGWEDYQHWVRNDSKVLEKLNDLIEETCRTPFKGTGKPEPLKGDFSGYWSRRISGEHRLVYLYKGDTVYIVMCRYHYKK